MASALSLCLGTWSLPLHFLPPRPLLRRTLSLYESKGSMTPWKSRLCGIMVLLSPWLYYQLPCICVPFFVIGRSASAALWYSSESISFLTDALLLGSEAPLDSLSLPRHFRPPASTPLCSPSGFPWSLERQTVTPMHGLRHYVAGLASILFFLASLVATFAYSVMSSDLPGSLKRI
ncbi:hypothetical protein GW17_00052864 [Ensete ventricosum]|nr:hypothetical protein GW17_00052864 [Ensete ventricosum]